MTSSDDKKRLDRLENRLNQVETRLAQVEGKFGVVIRHLEIYGVEVPPPMTENPTPPRLSRPALKTLRQKMAAHARSQKPVKPGSQGGVSSHEIKAKLEREAENIRANKVIRKKGDSES